MKKFKKTAVYLLAAVMILSMTVAAFGEAVIDADNPALPAMPSFGYVTGEVLGFLYDGTEARRLEFVRIQGEHGEAHLRWDRYYTFLLGGELAEGNTITAFYDMRLPAMLIYPPQFRAIAVVNSEEDLPFVVLGRFGENFVSDDNRYRLNITDETEILLHNGQPYEFEAGRLMLVEYIRSHRDINPTTIFPTRIHVLFEPLPSNEYGQLPETEEIDWSQYQVVVSRRGVPGATFATVGDWIFPNYVSLRPITEFLDVELEWDSVNRTITMDNPNPLRPDETITIRINSNEFYSAGVGGRGLVIINDPALIIDETTFVPIIFFREVLGFNNAWFGGGIVTIDNEEAMQ